MPHDDQALDAPSAAAARLGPSRSAAQQHRLIRSVLLVNGVVVASFRKHTHETHTIVLEDSGHAYTYIHPNGSQTRHLSPTARSSHRAMLIDALRLRNQFAWHTHASSACVLPYVHRALCEQRDGGISSTPLTRRPSQRNGSSSSSDQHLRARWPTGEFTTDALVDTATRSFEVQSIEGNARVRLHPSAAVVDAFFRVHATSSSSSSSDDDSDSSSPHSYVATVQQTFAVQHAPLCFAYAVALLLRAQRAHATGQRTFALRQSSGDRSASALPPCSAALPASAALSARPTFTALATARTDDGDDDGDAALTLDDVLRVASRPTRRLYAHVAAEVTEDATFLVCRAPPDAAATVLVLLARRTGVLECSRGYFRWFARDGHATQQFTIETVPPAAPLASASAPGAPDSTRASIEALCRHAMELAQAPRFVSTRSASATTLARQQSSDVVEAVETPLGRFRAFADRRVRVVFADRTILEVDAAHEHCAFFYPDGAVGRTTARAASAAPQSHEHRCIERALEFRDWAFATPRERMLRHVRRQLHDEVASQELRKISVRCGLNRADSEGPRRSQPSSRRPSASTTASADSAEGPQTSLALVQQLQDATLRHIASVNALLRDSSER